MHRESRYWEIFFNFDDILNYKSKKDASALKNNDDEEIDTATEGRSDENENDNVSNDRSNLRDEMLENGNFDLQKCIAYFVNQLQVEYFMKIRQEIWQW